MSLRVEDIFSLDGKVVLLTGGSGFLGRTFVEALLENGATLIALGRPGRFEAAAADWIERFGKDRAHAYVVDMYDLSALGSVLDRVNDDHPLVDVLINNAHDMSEACGFNTPEGRLDAAPADQWMRNLTAGVYWAALTTRKIGAPMADRGAGSIINVSTMYARVAPSPKLYAGTDKMNPPGYSAAKAGLCALTRYTASFWGPRGVRANAILPGPFSNVDEEGPNSVSPDDPFLARLSERTCLNRVGRPGELVGALLLLAGDASSYITGAEIVVDGGWTVT